MNSIEKAFEPEDFLKSQTYLSERSETEMQIKDVYQSFISEDYIKSGKFINYETLNERTQEIKENYNSEIQNINENYKQWLESDATKSNPSEVIRLTTERDALIVSKRAECEKKIAEVKDELIADRMERFETTKKNLSENNNIIYSVYADKKLIYGPDASTYTSRPDTVTSKHRTQDNKEMEIYFCYTPEAFKTMKADFMVARADGFLGLYYLLGGCFLCLLGLIWLIFATGELNLLDRIYLDVAAAAILAAYAVYVSFVGNYAGAMIHSYVPAQAYLAGGVFALLYLLTPWWCVTAIKRIKHRRFWKSTFAISALLFVFGLFKKLGIRFRSAIETMINSDKLTKTVMAHFYAFLGIYGVTGLLAVFFAAVSGNVFSLFVGIILIIVETVYFAKLVVRKTQSIEVLALGVKGIKGGNFNEKIPETGVAIVDGISNDVNNLADGLKVALRNEIRAEHMKVELVTNVSHDLKTPLTSIINYVDLLSKESLTPEKANEYVAILQSKSARLKHLVEDLFEVSKANSGTGTISIEPLSLNDLLYQAVGEYEDKFNEKNFDVRLNLGVHNIADPANKLMIKGDSARMWRVLSNLLDNVIKYGMDSTRVYIDCGQDDHNGWVSIKNISRYEMNFPAEEITERFKQGDESRSGDGSGLGLAIVKSFMKLQDGSCEITVDGDLFKVLIKVPLA